MTISDEMNAINRGVIGKEDIRDLLDKENSRKQEGRKQFHTGAVRGTDLDDVRYDLVPGNGLRRVALTCAEGAKKYGANNYKRGIPVSDLVNHAMNHVELYREGDKSEDHLAHAIWNLMVACEMEQRPDTMDMPWAEKMAGSVLADAKLPCGKTVSFSFDEGMENAKEIEAELDRINRVFASSPSPQDTRAASLNEFEQRLWEWHYKKYGIGSFGRTVRKFHEEVGELSEALLNRVEYPHEVANEAVDVTMLAMHLVRMVCGSGEFERALNNKMKIIEQRSADSEAAKMAPLKPHKTVNDDVAAERLHTCMKAEPKPVSEEEFRTALRQEFARKVERLREEMEAKMFDRPTKATPASH